ncbi:unnamed protein product, partial [marine sediment metagenome]
RIGREKGEKLEELLLTCDSSYSKKFWKWATTKFPGFKRLEELPLEHYDQMLRVVEARAAEEVDRRIRDKEIEGFEQNGSES